MADVRLTGLYGMVIATYLSRRGYRVRVLEI
ncbi:MAG: NAD(P)/FAD-dependent oxidoreductase [Actinomycetota bacterium]|nr:NAD(P)/FAD-dependent oxidoreductase [Actinomycetota bacterium]